MRQQQAFESPVVAAITLIQSHADQGPATKGGSHYAQHRAAEVEAWAQRDRHEPKSPQEAFWVQTAVLIADMRIEAEHPDDERWRVH